jgi:hypothetical protein
MKKFLAKPFTITILSIFLLEILSFAGWFYSGFGNIVLALILVATLLLSLKDLRYGIAIILAELIIGSHGYLFSFKDTFLPSLSLRIGLFVVIMLAFIWYVVRKKEPLAIVKTSIFKPLLVFATFVGLAFTYGIVNNGAGIAFSDANSYIYFLLAFPLWQAFTKFDDLKMLIEVGLAAVLMISLKGLAILYMFSHFITFGPWMPNVYRWVRDTRIGEITQNEQAEVFFRIFFASHIWVAIAFAMLFVFWLAYIKKQIFLESVKSKKFWFYLITLTVTLTSTLVSLSRANWVGLVCTAIIWIILFFLISKHPWKKLIHAIVSTFVLVLLSGVLVTSIVLFPFPPTPGGFSAGDLFKSRVSNLTGGEAAIDSRWGLLPPMQEAIKENPLVGHGFGKQLTYITEDPRIRAENPSGEYTTHAFEWGYLELWIKLGGLGLIAYLGFIFILVKDSLKALLAKRKQGFSEQDHWLLAGFLGGVTVLVTHVFSPYLNHPLGIGYLLFWGLILTLTKTTKVPKIKAI